jgi:hypothetical protein
MSSVVLIPKVASRPNSTRDVVAADVSHSTRALLVFNATTRMLNTPTVDPPDDDDDDDEEDEEELDEELVSLCHGLWCALACCTPVVVMAINTANSNDTNRPALLLLSASWRTTGKEIVFMGCTSDATTRNVAIGNSVSPLPSLAPPHPHHANGARDTLLTKSKVG